MHHAHIDKFAYEDSWFHRLDARVKLGVALTYTALVLSLQTSSPSLVFCYAVGPFVVLVGASIPLRFVFRHILWISPVILALALSSPFYDRRPMDVAFGPLSWTTTAGWLHGSVILCKFCISMMTLIGLISTTRFSSILAALQWIHVPRVLVIQLAFLYRHIFVLIDTAHRLLRAAAARRFRYLGFSREIQIAGAMVGSMLVRSLDTAEHIHRAMQGRGFTGQWYCLERTSVGKREWIFAAAALGLVAGLRFGVGPALGQP